VGRKNPFKHPKSSQADQHPHTQTVIALCSLEQLAGSDNVKWSHRLLSFERKADGKVEACFMVEGRMQRIQTDLLVGADGIRSAVGRLLINQDTYLLRYLRYMVILGICPMDKLKPESSPLLDQSTISQTVNDSERIYVMPYSPSAVMWQLSFPLPEKAAELLECCVIESP
jgi:2-polyprenyl-6-methoxyphenol hydroxylase-like FAD-dependent oxidoreductase